MFFTSCSIFTIIIKKKSRLLEPECSGHASHYTYLDWQMMTFECPCSSPPAKLIFTTIIIDAPLLKIPPLNASYKFQVSSFRARMFRACFTLHLPRLADDSVTLSCIFQLSIFEKGPESIDKFLLSPQPVYPELLKKA